MEQKLFSLPTVAQQKVNGGAGVVLGEFLGKILGDRDKACAIAVSPLSRPGNMNCQACSWTRRPGSSLKGPLTKKLHKFGKNKVIVEHNVSGGVNPLTLIIHLRQISNQKQNIARGTTDPGSIT